MNVSMLVYSLKYIRKPEKVVPLSIWIKHEMTKINYKEETLRKYINCSNIDILNELIPFTNRTGPLDGYFYLCDYILQKAFKHGYINIVKYFINNNLLKLDSNSLYITCKYRRIPIIKLLLEYQVPVDNHLIKETFEKKQFDILELLLPNMKQFYILLYDILIEMIKLDHVNITKIILDQNEDLCDPKLLLLAKSTEMKKLILAKINKQND